MNDTDNSVDTAEETLAPEEGQAEEVVDNEPDMEDDDDAQSDESIDEESPQYAGKFKSPEDLENAYNELEKKLGEQGQELAQARRSAPSEIAPDVNREQVDDNLPRDEVDEMLEFFREQKKTKHSETISQLDQEDFEKDSALNPHIKPYKDLLLKLGKSPEYRATPFSEIYKDIKGTIETPIDTEEFNEMKKNATTVKSRGSKNKGTPKWTKDKIAKLSAADFNKFKPEIEKYLLSKRK